MTNKFIYSFLFALASILATVSCSQPRSYDSAYQTAYEFAYALATHDETTLQSIAVDDIYTEIDGWQASHKPVRCPLFDGEVVLNVYPSNTTQDPKIEMYDVRYVCRQDRSGLYYDFLIVDIVIQELDDVWHVTGWRAIHERSSEKD